MATAQPLCAQPTLRRLCEQDRDAFLALRLQGYATDARYFRSTAADDAALGEARWAEWLGDEYVIAGEHAGVLVARGGLAAVRGQKLDHKGLVWGMYVAPTHRGGGLADRLMDGLLQEAACHYRQVILTVFAGNARARAFYERHGFAVYGIEPDAIRSGDEYFDEASMWRRV